MRWCFMSLLMGILSVLELRVDGQSRQYGLFGSCEGGCVPWPSTNCKNSTLYINRCFDNPEFQLSSMNICDLKNNKLITSVWTGQAGCTGPPSSEQNNVSLNNCLPSIAPSLYTEVLHFPPQRKYFF